MVDHQTIAAKIALPESVVWDILVDRFNSTPTLLVRQGNTLKRNYRHDMRSKPHLILNLSAKRFGRSFLIP
jgi:hypothetical protein